MMFVIFTMVMVFVVGVGGAGDGRSTGGRCFDRSVGSCRGFGPACVGCKLSDRCVFTVSRRTGVLLCREMGARPIFLECRSVVSTRLLIRKGIMSGLSSINVKDTVKDFKIRCKVNTVGSGTGVSTLKIGVLIGGVAVPHLLIIYCSKCAVSDDKVATVAFGRMLSSTGYVLSHLGVVITQRRVCRRGRLDPRFESSAMSRVLGLIRLGRLGMVARRRFRIRGQGILGGDWRE